MSAPNNHVARKRLIVCCDGTWQNSNEGYVKPRFWAPKGKVQVPSNVTRISRSFRRSPCVDGTMQVIYYQSGVGSEGSAFDVITGGAFGNGIAENIREAYSFICANYEDGDEIVLVGFSRGAFTARSVAGMIGELGLLTREGMDYFYAIFKDMENWQEPHYNDPFPNTPFSNKPRNPNGLNPSGPQQYKEKLLQMNLTRVYTNKVDAEGNRVPITVKAVAVWDTVGSLGIPPVGWLAKLGIRRSTEEFRFYDTNLSDRIEFAFQALALDEHRPPFSPAVWERTSTKKGFTDLRQVWFPGNHTNVGGGWEDAGVANLTLTWMMDQLASVGVEFDEGCIERMFDKLKAYYNTANANESSTKDVDSEDGTSVNQGENVHAAGIGSIIKRVFTNSIPWAIEPIYNRGLSIRPWSLGQIQKASSFLYTLTGSVDRKPGFYRKIDPFTGEPMAFLENTNERIHSSVRVRLQLQGLDLNDKKVWDCPALRESWICNKTTEMGPVSSSVKLWPGMTKPDGQQAEQTIYESQNSPHAQWQWKFSGKPAKGEGEPPVRVLVEETLGPYERRYLSKSAGTPNAWDFAEQMIQNVPVKGDTKDILVQVVPVSN